MSKRKTESSSLFRGGILFLVLCAFTTSYSLLAYFYGTSETISYSGFGNRINPAEDPKGYGSIFALILSAILGVIGISLIVIGIIKRVRTSGWSLRKTRPQF